MTPEVQRIYNFVSQQEDSYYWKLKGDGSLPDLLTTAQATAFQRVRYFIEEQEVTNE